jgi:integrase/recombinase XerD
MPNRVLLSLDYDFLARHSELAITRSDNLKFTPYSAINGMIRKSKTGLDVKGRLVFGSERSAKLIRKYLRQKYMKI